MYRASAKLVMTALFLGLIVLLGVQVVLRYAFGIGLIWADELSRIIFVWVSFLGLALAYERGEIPAFTLLQESLSARVALGLRVFINTVCIIFLLTLSYFGYQYALRVGGEPVPSLVFLVGRENAPSMFWLFVSLPVGLGLLALRMSIDLYRWVRALISGEPLHESNHDPRENAAI